MIILGVAAFYHDSAAVIVRDGKIVAALEEERFSRIKHDNSFPYQAIKKCLEISNLKIKDIDYLAYYEKPLLKFERILQTFVETWPNAWKPFNFFLQEWLGEKIKIEQIVRKKVGFKGKIYYIPHHLSHAAATYFTSPFKKSAILTIDGVGEWMTTGMWLGQDNQIHNLGEINFPHSLGLFYSTWTAFLGFKVNNDEFKVMGLAAYGKPNYKKQVYKLIKLNDDGSFKLDLSYFSFRESFQMWNTKFEGLFGKPRKNSEPILQKHKDFAASLQSVTEEVYFSILNHLYSKKAINNLCLAGGVALNSLANGKIYSNTPYKKIYALGPAGDNGAALGAALYLYSTTQANKKIPPLTNLYLGNQFEKEKIKKIIARYSFKYTEISNESDLIDKVVNLLIRNKVVGWFQGKMEFGPRALGSRSILANPKLKRMKDIVNKIKKRESFRPFAASVLQENVHELFEVPEEKLYSPYMNFCFRVKKPAEVKIAAIVHEDKTCRIQTVNSDNGLYYRLIKRFFAKTGIPCVLNTSFNLSFEPIVENPDQAIFDFKNSSLDALVLENFIIKR